MATSTSSSSIFTEFDKEILVCLRLFFKPLGHPHLVTPITADHSEYNITTYVLAIHYHILNSQNNGKFLHIYYPIWHMPTYLHGSYMFQHYLKYFTGTYLPATNMQSLPIVYKYDIHANVLANFKYYNRYVATAYCSGYLKYAHKLW